MLPAEPEITDTRNGVLRKRRRLVRPLLFGDGEQPIDLAGVEAGQTEIEVRRAEFLQLEAQKLLVPICPRHRAVDHEAEGLHLLRSPFITEQDGDFVDSKFARRFEAQVTINDLTIRASQHRDLETELTDAAAHAIDGGVVLARVADVENELVDGPVLHPMRCRLRNHSSPRRNTDLVWRILSE